MQRIGLRLAGSEAVTLTVDIRLVSGPGVPGTARYVDLKSVMRFVLVVTLSCHLELGARR